MSVYPWNENIWTRLQQQGERMPHALLFAGAAGLGKRALAQSFIGARLCGQPTAAGFACGACQGCRLYTAGTHPDIFIATPAEDGKAILIDQVRDLIEFLNLKPHSAAAKFALVYPAEAMNKNAANALLKALEEPPASGYLVLVSAQPQALLPTVRSRCQRMEFRTPATATALAWLTEAGGPRPDWPLLLKAAAGAPVTARAMAEGDALALRQAWSQGLLALEAGELDPLALASSLKKSGAAAALAWLQTWVVDLVRVRLGVGLAGLSNPDRHSELQLRAKRLHLKQLFQLFDFVSQQRRFAGDVLDEQLVLEETLVHWTRTIRA